MTSHPARRKITSERTARFPNWSQRSHPRRFSPLKCFNQILFGDISLSQAALELARLARLKFDRWRERGMLGELNSQPVRLRSEFQRQTPASLLRHFRERSSPQFFTGIESSESSTAAEQKKLFPAEAEQLIWSAWLITKAHRWPLLGFGERAFGEKINWHQDPLSGRIWPLDFHSDITLWHNDGSDIRVLWELNRLGHFLTLGRAYALTKDERFAEELFNQLDSWSEQNPVACGVNWSCAMEVALRAMNLVASLMLFRHSRALNEERLFNLLSLLERHGLHIRRNLEFSYLATSNHYLSDVVGLLWIGIMVPELSSAGEWRVWALKEMLRELDEQVLADGADFEASTGYHRFVLELFLYSFILCRANNLSIDEKYWKKLELMLGYLRSYLRPDGSAPLIGDSDSSQALPIVRRAADDHGYLLALGSVIFDNASFKLGLAQKPHELLWILGEGAIREYEMLAAPEAVDKSTAFSEAGTYLLRKDDLYLLFNASGAGANGRGSHGHNDSMSIEVFACGRQFIVDPGSYVYTKDLSARHLFRSTAYHSTLQVDGTDQNSTNESKPFVIGDEAHSRVLRWDTNSDYDLLVAEHDGYKRLAAPLVHRRTVRFDKAARWWRLEDELLGTGEHEIAVRFHFDSGLEVSARQRTMAVAWDKITGARLFVCSLDLPGEPNFESQFVSRDYGSKEPSVSACWSTRTNGHSKFRWALVPVCANEDEADRLRVISAAD